MFIVFRIMEIILSPTCKSFTGSLGRGFGYHIQHRKNGYFVKRNTRGFVPPDGHWRFILACADIAKSKLHISDIAINWMELSDALYSARQYRANEKVRDNGRRFIKTVYYAQDIINLKHTFGL